MSLDKYTEYKVAFPEQATNFYVQALQNAMNSPSEVQKKELIAQADDKYKAILLDGATVQKQSGANASDDEKAEIVKIFMDKLKSIYTM